MQNAALSKDERTLVLASLHNALAFLEVSAQMRCLFGPSGYKSRQDVPVAADMDAPSEEEDFAAWAAYRKAKRTKKDGDSGEVNGEPKKRKPPGGRRARNGCYRRTGQRNRRYICNSEYHYVPKGPKKRIVVAGLLRPRGL